MKHIKLLLASLDQNSQELALTLAEGLNIDLQQDLSEYYTTYQFLEQHHYCKGFQKGLKNNCDQLLT